MRQEIMCHLSLVLTTAGGQGNRYHYPHFIDEEIKAEVAQLIRSRAGICPQERFPKSLTAQEGGARAEEGKAFLKEGRPASGFSWLLVGRGLPLLPARL